MVRAWRSLDRFEGRAALRTWLYRIATNVCLDMLKAASAAPGRWTWRRRRPTPSPRRALPEAPGSTGARRARSPRTATRPSWRVARDDRLAFVAALQHLPPRQRAVLILREVLGWSGARGGRTLDTTVAAVNSALQRARPHARRQRRRSTRTSSRFDDEQQELLARYVDAFERYDIDALVSLLHDDATFSMPPFAPWLQGRARSGSGTRAGDRLRGSMLCPVVQRLPAFAQYRPAPAAAGAVGAAHRGGDRRPDLGSALDSWTPRGCSRSSGSRPASKR